MKVIWPTVTPDIVTTFEPAGVKTAIVPDVGNVLGFQLVGCWKSLLKPSQVMVWAEMSPGVNAVAASNATTIDRAQKAPLTHAAPRPLTPRIAKPPTTRHTPPAATCL